jgi:MOSC domain-containing protein YiiM
MAVPRGLAYLQPARAKNSPTSEWVRLSKLRGYRVTLNGVATGILQQISRSNGGVPKFAITEPVMLTETGVEGDRQRDLRHHGGPFKGVLMIAGEVIEDLAARGFKVYPGALGENLTVTGLDPAMWRTGQQYRVGPDAVIELTTMRVPCNNLFSYGRYIGEELYDAECRAGDINSPHWARGGFYARVVRGGLLSPGSEVCLLSDVA